MSINWDTPVSRLMHSDVYECIELDDDEMLHFKYVKRVKKNGKWVYYYDQASAGKDLRNAKAVADLEKSRALSKQAQYHETKAKYDNAKIDLGGGSSITFGKDIGLDTQMKQAAKDYKRAARSAKIAVAKYETQKVASMISKVAVKTVNKVKSWFSGLFKKR